MKHGLKQQIKRGLSVLMAVSMVASSALPVMAEEVVEEAVEVEVVSEEVADAEEDIVIDVAAEDEAVEEVLDSEEVIVEDSADLVDNGPAGENEQQTVPHANHIWDYKKGVLTVEVNENVAVGNDFTGTAAVRVPCEIGGETVNVTFSSLPNKPGLAGVVYNNELQDANGNVLVNANTYALVISVNKDFQKADCSIERDAKATFQLYVVPESDKNNNGTVKTDGVLLECVRTESDVVSNVEYTKAWKHRMPATTDTDNYFTVIQPTCMTLGEATYTCTNPKCKKPVKNEPIKMHRHEWYTDGTVYWNDDASDAWMIFTCNYDPEDEAHATQAGHKPHTVKISLKDFIKEYENTAGINSELEIQRPTCTVNGHVYYVIDATTRDIERLLGFRQASDTLAQNDVFVNEQGSVINPDFEFITVANAKQIVLRATGHDIKDVAFNWVEIPDETEGILWNLISNGLIDEAPVLCGATFVCGNGEEKGDCVLNRVLLVAGQREYTDGQMAAIVPDGQGGFTVTTPAALGITNVTGFVEEVASKHQDADCSGKNEVRYYHGLITLAGTTYDSSATLNDRYMEVVNTNPLAHHTFNVEGANTLDKAIAGTVTKQPTCVDRGVGVFKCEKCGVLSNSDEMFTYGTYAGEYKVKDKVTDILPLGHDIVPSTTYASKATCVADATLDAQCSKCKKHVDIRPVPLGIPYKEVTQTTISETNDGLFAEDYAKLTVKNSKAHKFEIVNGSVEWAKDLKSVTVRVQCTCGASTHSSGALTDASGKKHNAVTGENGVWSLTLTAVPVIEKAATGFETGKMHYEAALKFTDDLSKPQDLGTLKSKSVEIAATGEKTVTTITINPKTVTYTGDRQKADVVTNGPKATVRYFRNAAMTQLYSGEPYTAGTYYVKATVAEGERYTAAEATGILVIKRAPNKVTVKPSAKTVKYNAKKAQKVSLTVTQKNIGSQTGKVTYSDNSKYISVSKKGIVTIKKGAKKGTYKVTVKVANTTNIEGTKASVTIKVK